MKYSILFHPVRLHEHQMKEKFCTKNIHDYYYDGSTLPPTLQCSHCLKRVNHTEFIKNVQLDNFRLRVIANFNH